MTPRDGVGMAGGSDDIVGRFTRRELREMGARAVEYVKANQSTLPLLGEAEDVGVCRFGHPLTVQGERRRCLVCANERQWERRGRQ